MITTSDVSEAVLIITNTINHLLTFQSQVNLAVPGGRSVKTIFEALCKNSDISWEKVHVFMVDERLVPIDHDDSNFKLVQKQFTHELVEQGKLPKENLHPFILKDKDDYGLSDYEQELKKNGESYDVIILGVGEDAHVGALYPLHSINNDAEYFVSMQDSPKPPPMRMTASRKLLSRAKLGIVLFLGEGKREAYEKFKDSNVSMEECPAKLVQRLPQAVVLTDLE